MTSRSPLLPLTLALSVLVAACATPDEPEDRGQPDTYAATQTQARAVEDDAGATASAGPAITLTAELVTDEVQVPREVVALDDQLLISDQVGLVHVLGADGQLRDEPFLDVRDLVEAPEGRRIEHGLVGFALAPDVADTGHVYTVGTQETGSVEGVEEPEGTTHLNVLTRWTADLEDLVVDPTSAQVVLALPGQAPVHTAGEIVFDDQGLLYTALGAPAGDETAQDPQTYAGTVVRIDPQTGETAYQVPPDNPFVDGGGRPEVFAYGYRNPWRLDWDPELGLLVGEAMARDKRQQVGAPRPGDNAGYPLVRGACWEGATLAPGCGQTTDGAAIAPPVLEYDTSVGTILSGVVAVPESAQGALAGTVLVADWSGDVLVAEPGAAPWSWSPAATTERLITPASYLWDLAVTDDGTVYALVADRDMAQGQGAVLRLAATDCAWCARPGLRD